MFKICQIEQGFLDPVFFSSRGIERQFIEGKNFIYFNVVSTLDS